jgi:superfamily II DNA or RNA helicase
VKILVVSKVANFCIDLPDASVAIEISGTFGSRQEEAQRLGRILRPKSNPSTGSGRRVGWRTRLLRQALPICQIPLP